MHPEQLHLHKRKRIHQKLHKYPSSNKTIKFVDNLVSVIVVLYPLTGVPQILKIWTEKSVEGVSLLSWSLFFIFTIPLLLYGIVHKDKRLVILWGLWELVYLAVIIGVWTFR